MTCSSCDPCSCFQISADHLGTFQSCLALQDEYLNIEPQRSEPQQQPLRSYLDSIWPEKTASLSLQALWYPVPCQGKPITAGVSSRDMHVFVPMRGQGKSIVMPGKISTYNIHTASAVSRAADGSRPNLLQTVSPARAHFKHVRKWAVCSSNTRQRLENDTQLDRMQQIFSNTTAWPAHIL